MQKLTRSDVIDNKIDRWNAFPAACNTPVNLNVFTMFSNIMSSSILNICLKKASCQLSQNKRNRLQKDFSNRCYLICIFKHTSIGKIPKSHSSLFIPILIIRFKIAKIRPCILFFIYFLQFVILFSCTFCYICTFF